MTFDEIQFPTDISENAKGGPEFRTRVITLGSGFERRNQDWPAARASYNVSQGLRNKADFDTTIAFFRARRGKARGFRFKDWTDYQVTLQQFGTGDATTTEFGLIKAYTDGLVTVNRDITKPVNGSVHIFKDGVEAISGWTLDYTTGLVTFSVAPANGVVIAWTGEFDVPVRFDTDHLNANALNPELEEWPDIPLVEIRVTR